MYPYPNTGEKKWVLTKGRGWPRKLDDGAYVYVVLPDTGEVRFSEKPRPYSNIHHPELCAGEEVAGAGLFYLRQKVIVRISNESGHYAPAADSMYFVKMAFRHWGAPLAENLDTDTSWEIFGNR